MHCTTHIINNISSNNIGYLVLLGYSVQTGNTYRMWKYDTRHVYLPTYHSHYQRILSWFLILVFSVTCYLYEVNGTPRLFVITITSFTRNDNMLMLIKNLGTLIKLWIYSNNTWNDYFYHIDTNHDLSNFIYDV